MLSDRFANFPHKHLLNSVTDQVTYKSLGVERWKTKVVQGQGDEPHYARVYLKQVEPP